jgi:hypothetical protein
MWLAQFSPLYAFSFVCYMVYFSLCFPLCKWHHGSCASTSVIQCWMMMMLIIIIVNFCYSCCPVVHDRKWQCEGGSSEMKEAASDFVTPRKLAFAQWTEGSVWSRCWHGNVMWTAAYLVSVCCRWTVAQGGPSERSCHAYVARAGGLSHVH